MLTEINGNSDRLVSALLENAQETGLCILDSCGSEHEGSRWMFAGTSPIDTLEISGDSDRTLKVLDEVLTGDKPAVFTISYELGRKINGLTGNDAAGGSNEPDLFISTFDSLFAHDYVRGESVIAGTRSGTDQLSELLRAGAADVAENEAPSLRTSEVDFPKREYLDTVDTIKEYIRCGETYQTNLTQRFDVELPPLFTGTQAFKSLRQKYPAPFSAYIERPGSTVVSASPECFFRVDGRKISVSPIKGTRPRGKTATEDRELRRQLMSSEKDRAENTMIVDLMRNDLGRVCEFGSVQVRELFRLQRLPTVFHLVSTVEGMLRRDVMPSDIVRALFPCGSITGAPKISTMKIIDELESESRGISMGAIGIYIPDGFGLAPKIELSVAIRTMVIRDGRAVFNVGGGIVIDSDPEQEYDEVMAKAEPLLAALGASISSFGNDSDRQEHFRTSAV